MAHSGGIFVCAITLNSCLNFWDEAYWFLSLRVFGLLSSSLFPQHFSRYVLRPSSGVCRTREPSLCPLLNPRGSPVLITLAITGYKCYVLLYWTCSLQMIVSFEALGTNAYNRYAMFPAGQFRVNFRTYKLNVLTWLEWLLCMIFLPVLIFRFFSSLI